MLLDRHFERRIVRNRNPVRIVGGFDEFRRHWIARQPELRRLVVDAVRATQNLGAGVGGIAMDSDFTEHQRAASFIITVEDVRSTVPRSDRVSGGALLPAAAARAAFRSA